MGAHHHQLGNLTAMVDINALQADGKTDTVLRTEPVTEKWEAFGWYTQRVDGNDMADAAARLRQRRRPGRRRRTSLRDPLRHESGPRRAAAGGPRKGALHAHRRTRMAALPRATDRRIRRKGHTDEQHHRSPRHHSSRKPKLKTSAMIASFADPGPEDRLRPVRARPGQGRAGKRQDRRPHRGPGQVHGHAHLRPGLPGAVLPDGHGRTAALRRRRRPGRDRPGPVRLHLLRVRRPPRLRLPLPGRRRTQPERQHRRRAPRA